MSARRFSVHPRTRHEVIRRARRARRRQARARRWLIGFALVLLGAVLSAFFYLRPFLINRVIVRGAETLSEREVEETVKTVLASRYGGIVPRAHVFFYPRGLLRERLARLLPRLASVNFELAEGPALVVKIVERRGQMVWCNESGEANEERCYFADGTGNIFAPAPTFAGPVFFRLRGKLEPEPIGTRPLEAETISRLLGFREHLEEVLRRTRWPQASAPSASLGAGGEIIFDIELDEGGFKVLVSPSQNLDEALANLSAALEATATAGQFAQPLWYIDLRFSPKIFYQPSAFSGRTSNGI